MRIEDKKQLEGLQATTFGQVLKRFLDEEYAEIKDITKAKDEIDMKARQHAIKVLDKLFAFMKTNEKKKKSSGTYI